MTPGNDAVWSGLVSRAIRVTLARQDMSYADLAAAMLGLGLAETSRSVEAKAQRGTFRFTFFLQTLVASRTDYPVTWSKAMTSKPRWEARASAVLREELSQHPWLTWDGLSARLGEIGIVLAAEDLKAHVNGGNFSASLFLQCATVCRFDGIERFVDISALNRAALGAPGPGEHIVPRSL